MARGKTKIYRFLAAAAALSLVLSACKEDKRDVSSAVKLGADAAAVYVRQVRKLPVAAGEERFSLDPGEERTVEISDPLSMPRAEKENTAVKVSLSGETVFSGGGDLADFVPPENGTYRYEFSYMDQSYFVVVNTDFAPRLFCSRSEVLQGEAVPLAVRYAGDGEVKAVCDLPNQPVLFKTGGGWLGFLPVRWDCEPGEYNLAVTADGTELAATVTVKEREFETQYLTIDEETEQETVENAAANAEWNELVEPLKYISDPQQYWHGPFLRPVEGELTTQYGSIRYTNDDTYPTRHSGADIAAPLGTPVKAAGAGRVLFAGYLKLTGNTVLIEHGLGLKSWYYHMNSLNTSAGDMVKQGDIIGEVGSTGFSTGPHLHFAMSVNSVYVNPWTAVEEGFNWEGGQNEGDDF